MVGVAQLVERLVVVQKVAGSSPVTHPEENVPEGFTPSGTFVLWPVLMSRRLSYAQSGHNATRHSQEMLPTLPLRG